MTSALVRERELRSLVMDLDAATEILESIGYRGTNDDALSLPLREAFALKSAIGCMSSEHFGQLAWQFKRMSGSSGLKVQAAIAC